MSSKSNKYKLTQNKVELLEFCKKNNLDTREVMPYQIRIDNKIDIYPTNKKYCILAIDQWGTYSKLTDILDQKNLRWSRKQGDHLIDLSDRDALIERLHKAIGM